MSLDYKPVVNVRNCYACIQWDGNRTFNSEKKNVLVDDRSEANCRVFHKKMKGTSFCERYMPMI